MESSLIIMSQRKTTDQLSRIQRVLAHPVIATLVGLLFIITGVFGFIGCLALITWLPTIPGALYTLTFKPVAAIVIFVPQPQCSKATDSPANLIFQYQIDGLAYTSNKTAGAWGNLGFTADCGQAFYQSVQTAHIVTAYVNPARPSQAVLVKGIVPPSHFYFNFLCIALCFFFWKLRDF